MNVGLHAAASPVRRTATDEVATLYRAHLGFVWQVLHKLGVEPGSVEDAAHDVFMVAHRRWREFEGRSAARTWLFAVARRVASRHRRADFRQRRRRAALALVARAEVAQPDAILARKEAWSALLAFLDGLDRDHREAFVLGQLEGVSRASMGRALGISPNTAYSRLRAARRRFAETFDDDATRRQVLRASAPASGEAKARVWAMLLAHAEVTRPAIAAGLLKAGLLSVVGTGLAVAVLVAPGPSRPPGPIGSSATHAESRVASDSVPGVGSVPGEPRRVEPKPARVGVVASPPPRSLGSRQPGAPTPRLRPAARAAPSETPAPSPPAVQSATAPPPDPAFSDLDPAMAWLAQARRALAQRHPAEALADLQRSRRLDAEGVFATERAVTRVLALCAAERARQASDELRRLQRATSASAYAAVLADSCVAEMIRADASGHQGG